MKIILGMFIILDLVVLIFFIYGVYVSIKAGGGSVAFPGLGIIVAMPLALAVILLIELGLITITLLVYQYAKNNSVGLI